MSHEGAPRVWPGGRPPRRALEDRLETAEEAPDLPSWKHCAGVLEDVLDAHSHFLQGHYGVAVAVITWVHGNSWVACLLKQQASNLIPTKALGR
jgi:hypothetical protein